MFSQTEQNIFVIKQKKIFEKLIYKKKTTKMNGVIKGPSLHYQQNNSEILICLD